TRRKCGRVGGAPGTKPHPSAHTFFRLCLSVRSSECWNNPGDNRFMIWVLKLSGAVLVSISGFLFGAEQAAGLHRQALFWAELARMLAQIQDAVHYRALATPCLLEELRAGDYPHLLLNNCTALESYCFPAY